MKKILLFAFVGLSLVGCQKYKNKEVYANVPVYLDYAAFRQSFSFETGAIIQGTGNIFVYNQFIFLSEEDKGIHIINNTDPTSPFVEGFMNIPGNTQMAVKGNYLYANSYIDLLVIDIANMSAPTLANRILDVFDYSTPATNDNYPIADVHKDKGVVVSWKIEKTKEITGFGKKMFVSDCEECEQTEVQTKSASSMPTALSGSMSKFAIEDNFLYTIDNNNIISFDITSANAPNLESNQPTWKTAESLFSKDGYLYMGTTTGMVIYNVKSMPSQPEQESEIEHVESCDPVIVSGEYAYITLRSGTDCGGAENELQVIDISNKKFPFVKHRYNMTNPRGLGIDDGLLFLCDGEDGLKIFDASNPSQAGKDLLYNFDNIVANDIILNNGIAILITDDGVYQYNYTNPQAVQYISALTF